MLISPSHDRIIHQIHRHLSVIVASVVIVGGLIAASLYHQGIIGPIRSNLPASLLLEWKISDHNASGKALPNDLNDVTDQPFYDDETTVLDLSRDSNGFVQALPRFQGTLRYCKVPDNCRR